MSSTYIALLVSGIASLANHFGYSVNVPVVNANLDTVIIVASWAYAFYGRYKAGGISVFGVYKA